MQLDGVNKILKKRKVGNLNNKNQWVAHYMDIIETRLDCRNKKMTGIVNGVEVN